MSAEHADPERDELALIIDEAWGSGGSYWHLGAADAILAAGYSKRALPAPPDEVRYAKRCDATETDAEMVARTFHGTYELLAPSYGYKTRDESAVEWADVPQANKNLMCAVTLALLNAEIITVGGPVYVLPADTAALEGLASAWDVEVYRHPSRWELRVRDFDHEQAAIVFSGDSWAEVLQKACARVGVASRLDAAVVSPNSVSVDVARDDGTVDTYRVRRAAVVSPPRRPKSD